MTEKKAIIHAIKFNNDAWKVETRHSHVHHQSVYVVYAWWTLVLCLMTEKLDHHNWASRKRRTNIFLIYLIRHNIDSF